MLAWNSLRALSALLGLLFIAGCDGPASPTSSAPAAGALPTAAGAPAPSVTSPTVGSNAPSATDGATPSAAPGGGATSANIDDYRMPSADELKLSAPVRSRIQETLKQITEDSSDDKLFAALGALYWVNGPPQLAVKAYRRAQALNPKDARWPYLEGFSHEKAGDFKSAAEACARAFQLDSTFTRAEQRRGQLLTKVDPKQAIEVMKACVARDATDALSMLGIGEALEQQGDAAGALEWLRKALAAYPEFSVAHKAIARILEKQGDAAGAQQAQARAARGQPFPVQDIVQWEALVVGCEINEMVRTAVMSAEQKNFADAERLIMMAMQIAPSSVEVRRAMAGVRLLQNKPQEAISALTRILDEHPNDLSVRAQLGDLYTRAKRFDEALVEFRKVLEVVPNDSRVRMAMGQALMQAGKTDEATAEFKSLIAIVPEFDGPYLALSDIARTKKDHAEMERLLRECLKQSPNSLIGLNSLAWHLAAHRDAAVRKPDEALQLATRAAELSKFQQHEFIDTLAVALAATGKFEDALKRVEQAIALAQQAKAGPYVREYRGRLEQFKQRKPYTDP